MRRIILIWLYLIMQVYNMPDHHEEHLGIPQHFIMEDHGPAIHVQVDSKGSKVFTNPSGLFVTTESHPHHRNVIEGYGNGRSVVNHHVSANPNHTGKVHASFKHRSKKFHISGHSLLHNLLNNDSNVHNSLCRRSSKLHANGTSWFQNVLNINAKKPDSHLHHAAHKKKSIHQNRGKSRRIITGGKHRSIRIQYKDESKLIERNVVPFIEPDELYATQGNETLLGNRTDNETAERNVYIDNASRSNGVVAKINAESPVTNNKFMYNNHNPKKIQIVPILRKSEPPATRLFNITKSERIHFLPPAVNNDSFGTEEISDGSPNNVQNSYPDVWNHKLPKIKELYNNKEVKIIVDTPVMEDELLHTKYFNDSTLQKLDVDQNIGEIVPLHKKQYNVTTPARYFDTDEKSLNLLKYLHSNATASLTTSENLRSEVDNLIDTLPDINHRQEIKVNGDPEVGNNKSLNIRKLYDMDNGEIYVDPGTDTHESPHTEDSNNSESPKEEDEITTEKNAALDTKQSNINVVDNKPLIVKQVYDTKEIEINVESAIPEKESLRTKYSNDIKLLKEDGNQSSQANVSVEPKQSNVTTPDKSFDPGDRKNSSIGTPYWNNNSSANVSDVAKVASIETRNKNDNSTSNTNLPDQQLNDTKEVNINFDTISGENESLVYQYSNDSKLLNMYVDPGLENNVSLRTQRRLNATKSVISDVLEAVKKELFYRLHVNGTLKLDTNAAIKKADSFNIGHSTDKSAEGFHNNSSVSKNESFNIIGHSNDTEVEMLHSNSSLSKNESFNIIGHSNDTEVERLHSNSSLSKNESFNIGYSNDTSVEKFHNNASVSKNDSFNIGHSNDTGADTLDSPVRKNESFNIQHHTEKAKIQADLTDQVVWENEIRDGDHSNDPKSVKLNVDPSAENMFGHNNVLQPLYDHYGDFTESNEQLDYHEDPVYYHVDSGGGLAYNHVDIPPHYRHG